MFVSMSWWALAELQHGVISRSQLLGHGIHASAIDRMLAADQLGARAAGTYLVRGAPLTGQARLWIATLSLRGVLGFATAAELWGLIDPRPSGARVHVVVPHARRVEPPGWIRVHRIDLPPRQVVVRNELAMTSRAWTLCD